MIKDNFLQAYTFSDVSLVPAYSEILPSGVDVSTSLGGKLLLNTPILSAAMDTVTKSRMAIAMASVGGLGVIHKNMSVAEQALEISRVKKYEAWVIAKPITIKPRQTILEAKKLVQEYGVSGFPVVGDDGKLLGMLTARDIRFANNESSAVSENMSKDLVVAKPDSDTSLCLDKMKHRRIEKLPLIDDNFRLVGLVTAKDIRKTSKFSHSLKDSQGRLCCAGAVGVAPDLEERAQALVEAGADALVLDCAHGHTLSVGESLQKLRHCFADLLLIAGNIVTADGAIFLHRAGADVIKVGIGPGSICTTRIVAGVGIPQLSAILGVGKAAKEHGFSVISDGGLQFSGDIVKALAAGAHAVMTGSLLAGTREAPGERLLFGGREFKVYRGMGSLSAMNDGSKDRYGQQEVNDKNKLVPEGIEGRIPYRGHVADVIFQLIGGLKAGMGYVGAKNIAELQEKSHFVSVSAAGQRESHVHDVIITKESPNYHIKNYDQNSF